MGRGSSSPKASLGKQGEKGSCVVERRASSSACPPWGRGNLSREGLGVVFEVGGSWFSDLLLCRCGAVLERVGDEILLFGGERREWRFLKWAWGCARDPEVFGKWVVVLDFESPSLHSPCTWQGKKPWWKPHRTSASLPCVVSQLEADLSWFQLG